MKRMLIVTSSYPDGNDGEAAAGVFVRDFAGALLQEGVAVFVVAPALRDSRMAENGIDVSRFAVPRLPLSLLDPRRPGDWIRIVRTLAAGSQAVSRICAVERPDHLLALWVLPCGDWARRAARRYGLYYSTWALGSDIWVLGKVPKLRAYLGSVLRDASARYADGFQLAADVERICGLPCSFLPSSRHLCLPVPTRQRKAPPYRLAFLGRWHPNKGVDLLLDALAALTDADWRSIEAVRLFGGGPLEAQVRDRASVLVAAGRPLVIGGYLDNSGAAALFRWADYVLLPSRIESIPVVFSDAMQAGCPVIATPVGDLPQLLNQYSCGVAANAVNAFAMADAIREALATTPARYDDGIRLAADAFDLAAAARRFLRDAEQFFPFSGAAPSTRARGSAFSGDAVVHKTDADALSNPRWGTKHRNRKANAILQTLRPYLRQPWGQLECVDLGCGNGEIASHISRHVKQVIGVDPEPWTDWKDLQQQHPNLRFVQESVENLSCADASADLVICNQVYEHVSDARLLIREIYRILKPGGYCYFAGPNLLFPIEPHVFWPFVHWLPRGFAVWLMRILGSRAILDANSKDYWRLSRWLSGFEIHNAVPYILKHPGHYGRQHVMWRGLRLLPESWVETFTCASPTFVFVVQKRSPLEQGCRR